MRTVQEQAWAGEHGNAYNLRSPGNEEANFRLFKRALMGYDFRSAVELGAGTGANLRALRRMRDIELTGVEINQQACEQIQAGGVAQAINASILGWKPERMWDLAFTKGVLIHIAPEDLPKAYGALFASSYRYIFIAEYYNPTPMEVPYRGQSGLLWKRDFAGEMLDAMPLRLLDYGFVYRRDDWPQDDLTWFLMEKK